VVRVDAAPDELPEAPEVAAERQARVRRVERHRRRHAGAEAHRLPAHVEHGVVGEDRAARADRRAVAQLQVGADVDRHRVLRDDDRVAARLEIADLVGAGDEVQALAGLDDDVPVVARRQRHVALDDERPGPRRERRQRGHRIDQRQRAGRQRTDAGDDDARRRRHEPVRIEIVDREAVTAHRIADHDGAVREDAARPEHEGEAYGIVHADIARRDRREILQVDAIGREQTVVVQILRWLRLGPSDDGHQRTQSEQ
jgi:hypothetical protein